MRNGMIPQSVHVARSKPRLRHDGQGERLARAGRVGALRSASMYRTRSRNALVGPPIERDESARQRAEIGSGFWSV
jgi:hypothetical protein